MEVCSNPLLAEEHWVVWNIAAETMNKLGPTVALHGWPTLLTGDPSKTNQARMNQVYLL